MYRILIVEDSQESQVLIKKSLNDRSLNLTFVSSIQSASEALENNRFDMILLDVSLPDGDGFQFCSAIKKSPKTSNISILFITGKVDVTEKVTAFDLGAEDYITKPFHPLELRARIQGRLKKDQTNKRNKDLFQAGNLRFVSSLQKVYFFDGAKEVPIDLTPIEFKLLFYLAENEEQVFSRDQLVTVIHGEDVFVLDRTIDSHISSVRKKIKHTGFTVRAVYGVGYAFSKAKTKKDLKKAA